LTASGICTLSAFIDFNRDGDWADTDESLFPGGRVLAAGLNQLSFTVPANASLGTAYARFRCTTDGYVSFTGQASNGEVEDYWVSIQEGTPKLQSSKTVSSIDTNANSRVDQGDQLVYTITITNSGTADATGVVFADIPDTNTALVNGSVASTAGAISSGNGSGQTSIGVNVGTLAAGGGTVTITFTVAIKDQLPSGVDHVINQGQITGGNVTTILTDDPTLPGSSDPTITPITPTVTVPTLDEWGFLILLMLLSWVGARALSRT